MRNPLQGIACALAVLMLTGCGSVMTVERPQDPPPDAKAIILRYLRGEQLPQTQLAGDPGPGSLFGDMHKLGVVELSSPSLVQHPALGWTWLTCLRTHPADKPASDYALFVGNDRIRDARLSVAVDGCGTRSYEVLGQIKPPTKNKNKTDKNKK